MIMNSPFSENLGGVQVNHLWH